MLAQDADGSPAVPAGHGGAALPLGDLLHNGSGVTAIFEALGAPIYRMIPDREVIHPFDGRAWFL